MHVELRVRTQKLRILLIFSGGCYYLSNDEVTGPEAAGKCALLSGARLASFADENDNLPSEANSGDFWIGTYLNPTPGGKLIVSDGRRQVEESFDRTTCSQCQCGYSNNGLRFADCMERKRYICEYKGD